MKIFVTGFQRSGTTLIENLISLHPDVKIMFHETFIQWVDKFMIYPTLNVKRLVQGKKDAEPQKVTVDWDYDKDTWGEKIPYYNESLSREGNSNQHTILDYIANWDKRYGDQARILHTIRHPFDVMYSTYVRGLDENPEPMRALARYCAMVPKITEALDENRRALSFKYESLLLHPREVLTYILMFLALDARKSIVDGILSSPKVYQFGGINPSRAFNYRSRKNMVKQEIIDVGRICNKLNEISTFSDDCHYNI